MKPKVEIGKHPRGPNDPKPWVASVEIDGTASRDAARYFSEGETPAKALLELATYWVGKESGK